MLNVHLNVFLEHSPKINKPEIHLGKLQNQNPSSCYLFILHERLGAAPFSAQICFINKKLALKHFCLTCYCYLEKVRKG